ncbi:MAG: iron transporter [Lachnospiraceae bacterium]|nr:iron transporter [Lachnospiraceae bacterium]
MKKKIFAMGLVVAMTAALAACGNQGSAQETPSANTEQASASASEEAPSQEEASEPEETAEATVETEEAAAAPSGGFEEIPIWEDEEIGFMNVNGVYFQPVPMSNGNENYEDYDMHFEADVSALQNNLGYGVGDWIPYLSVDFEITGSDGNVAAEGNFMPMSADDGPHYGANIKLPNADTYSVKLTFHSPEEAGYLIHLDDETGPGGTFDDYFKDGPLVLELKDVWDYVPQEW